MDEPIARRRDALAARLGDGFRVAVPSGLGEADLARAARDAQVVIARSLAPAVLEAAASLRLFQLWIAGAGIDVLEAHFDLLVTNLQRFRRGEPPLGPVDLDLGY